MMEAVYLITFLFAFACGRHDVPAVDNFHEYGSSEKHQKNFHHWNFVLKACYVIAVSFTEFRFGGNIWEAIRIGVCNTLIIWAVFDPVVALWRTPKMKWYYLSNGNSTDKFVKRWFGSKPGVIKFFACVIAVAILSIFKF